MVPSHVDCRAVACNVLWCVSGHVYARICHSRERSHCSTVWCHAGLEPVATMVVQLAFDYADSESMIMWSRRNQGCYNGLIFDVGNIIKVNTDYYDATTKEQAPSN